jgi:hypothetical protein
MLPDVVVLEGPLSFEVLVGFMFGVSLFVDKNMAVKLVAS